MIKIVLTNINLKIDFKKKNDTAAPSDKNIKDLLMHRKIQSYFRSEMSKIPITIYMDTSYI